MYRQNDLIIRVAIIFKTTLSIFRASTMKWKEIIETAIAGKSKFADFYDTHYRAGSLVLKYEASLHFHKIRKEIEEVFVNYTESTSIWHDDVFSLASTA